MSGDGSGVPLLDLFVYGTLMRAWSGHYANLLHANADFMGEASVNGRLYDLVRFPGAVFDAGERSEVLGELFRLKGTWLLDELDAYEACRPRDPLPHLFRRCVVQVKAGQTSTAAWAYELTGAGKARAVRVIPTGRFRRACRYARPEIVTVAISGGTRKRTGR